VWSLLEGTDILEQVLVPWVIPNEARLDEPPVGGNDRVALPLRRRRILERATTSRATRPTMMFRSRFEYRDCWNSSFLSVWPLDRVA
jgi:hypothetical protein